MHKNEFVSDHVVMEKVDSSNIAAVGYDEESSALFVEFKGGATYRYDGVRKVTFHAIVTADSVGKAFNALIRLNAVQFKAVKLGVNDEAE